jgi:hypothetical protein
MRRQPGLRSEIRLLRRAQRLVEATQRIVAEFAGARRTGAMFGDESIDVAFCRVLRCPGEESLCRDSMRRTIAPVTA